MTQTFRTTIDTKWNDVKRGQFTVPAGTLCTLASIKDADRFDEYGLREAVKRWTQQGRRPVLVLLEGKVRVFDRDGLERVEQAEGQEAETVAPAATQPPKGIDWSEVDL